MTEHTEENEGILLHFSASISDLAFVCHNLYSTWMGFFKCKFKNSISELTSCGFKGKNMSPSKTTPATGRQQPRETPTIAVLLRIKASNDDIYPTGDEFGGFHQVRERVFLFGCCHRASLADGALSCVVHRAGRIDVFAFTNCWEGGRTTLWRKCVVVWGHKHTHQHF